MTKQLTLSTVAFLLAATLLPACKSSQAPTAGSAQGSAAVAAKPATGAPTEAKPADGAATTAPAATAPTGPCANVSGIYNETWTGTAYTDKKELKGESTETIASLKGQGVDKTNAASKWAGDLVTDAGGFKYTFTAQDKSFAGYYQCTSKDATCGTLDCRVVITNADGSPNMTGNATWTKNP